jgi:hypothetical protein
MWQQLALLALTSLSTVLQLLRLVSQHLQVSTQTYRLQLLFTKTSVPLECTVPQVELLVMDMMFHRQERMLLFVPQLLLDPTPWDSQSLTAERVQLVFTVVPKLQFQQYVQEASIAQRIQSPQLLAL